MAFTLEQRSNIEIYLGYEPTAIDAEIDQCSLDATRETKAIACLSGIATADSNIASGIEGTGVWSTGKGETEMNRSVYLQEQRRQGRTLCNRLADLIRVKKIKDWYCGST